jgi:hypothetical protein
MYNFYRNFYRNLKFPPLKRFRSPEKVKERERERLCKEQRDILDSLKKRLENPSTGPGISYEEAVGHSLSARLLDVIEFEIKISYSSFINAYNSFKEQNGVDKALKPGKDLFFYTFLKRFFYDRYNFPQDLPLMSLIANNSDGVLKIEHNLFFELKRICEEYDSQKNGSFCLKYETRDGQGFIFAKFNNS